MPPTGPRWRPGDAAATPGRAAPGGSSSKTFKIFLLLAVLLAVTGAVAAFLFFVRPMEEPYFLSLPVREYETRQWPVNYFTVQDSELLLPRFKEERRKNAYDAQTGGLIQKELAALRSRPEEAIVVHLTCLARTYKDEVYLLPGDASPDAPERWLPLRDVLTALRQCRSPHRLLLLDIMRPIADPRLGILGDDVGQTLERQLEKEKADDLLILASCGRGQVSLISEDLRHSVFAHYLELGLRGHADGAGPQGHANGRVTASELAHYTREQVNRWAKANRGLEQTPYFWGQAPDFPLIGFEGKPEAEEAIPETEKYPAWLAKGWELRDQWWRDETYRLAPRAFRQLEGQLLRAEQRWRGGVEPARLEKDLADDLTRLKDRMKTASSLPAPPPPTSLLQVRALLKKPVAPVQEELRLNMLQVGKKEPLKAEDLKKLKDAFIEKHKKVPYADMAEAVATLAVTSASLKPEQLLFLGDLVSGLPEQVPYAETIALGQLADLHKKVLDKDWEWPVTAANQFLITRRAMEKTLAEAWEDPHALPWIEPLMKDADGRRRQGEKALFQDRPPAWPAAIERLKEAETLYGAAQRVMLSARDGRKSYDRAYAMMADIAMWMSAQEGLSDSVKRDWKSTVRALAQFTQRFESPAVDGASSLQDAYVDLGNTLMALEAHPLRDAKEVQAFALKGDRVTDDLVGPLQAEYAQCELLMATPIRNLSRPDLWQAGRTLGRKLLEKARADESDPKAKPAAGRTINPAAPERLAARQMLAMDLLELAGLDRIDLLGKKKDDRQPSAKGEAGQTLGDELRLAWATTLPNLLKGKDLPLARADRIARLRPPLALEGDDRAGEPALVMNREKITAFRTWLAGRYLEEKALYPEGSAGAFFYGDAATELTRSQ